MAGHAGNDAGRNAALGDFVSLVRLVFAGAVRGDELAAVDGGIEVEFLWIDAETAFGEEQVAEDDSGALEAVDDVEDLGNQLEAVGDVERRGDDAGVVAKGRAQHLPEIALLGLGGDAGGRAGALAVDDDDRNLR